MTRPEKNPDLPLSRRGPAWRSVCLGVNQAQIAIYLKSYRNAYLHKAFVLFLWCSLCPRSIVLQVTHKHTHTHTQSLTHSLTHSFTYYSPNIAQSDYLWSSIYSDQTRNQTFEKGIYDQAQDILDACNRDLEELRMKVLKTSGKLSTG